MLDDLEIIEIQLSIKGNIYTVKVCGKVIKVIFIFHAIERIGKWEIDEKKVIEALLFPEEVIIGHGGRFVAHKRYALHLVRAVYEYVGGVPTLITVYFPYFERYSKGGGIYEDKIFEGC